MPRVKRAAAVKLRSAAGAACRCHRTPSAHALTHQDDILQGTQVQRMYHRTVMLVLLLQPVQESTLATDLVFQRVRALGLRNIEK